MPDLPKTNSRKGSLSCALNNINLSGTGDSQRDSRESFAIETPIFIALQADSHESLELLIRANRVIRANRANRFARIAPLRYGKRLMGGQNVSYDFLGGKRTIECALQNQFWRVPKVGSGLCLFPLRKMTLCEQTGRENVS